MSRLWIVGLLCGCGSAAVAVDTDGSDTDSTEDSDVSATSDSDAPSDSGDTASTTGCDAADEATQIVIVTDIDETLTTDDNEWLNELWDPSHDPAMRPDANTLMNSWFNLGYRVIYLTARGEDLPLLDGTAARDATAGWLDAHGFPYFPEDVYLATGLGAFGSGAADYKTQVIADLQADGVTVVYAYGNADTDVEAFQNSAIPDDHIFLVGTLAGTLGVEGISDADAYTSHLATFMPGVDCAN